MTWSELHLGADMNPGARAGRHCGILEMVVSWWLQHLRIQGLGTVGSLIASHPSDLEMIFETE